MPRDYLASDFEQAEFNLAVGTILRIDETLRTVNYCFQIRDYKGCFEALQIIYSEISPFLKGNEPEEMDRMEKSIESGLNNSFRVSRNNGREFIATFEIDHKLRIWDRKLRRLMLKYKLYMKMIDNRLPAAKVG